MGSIGQIFLPLLLFFLGVRLLQYGVKTARYQRSGTSKVFIYSAASGGIILMGVAVVFFIKLIIDG